MNIERGALKQISHKSDFLLVFWFPFKFLYFISWMKQLHFQQGDKISNIDLLQGWGQNKMLDVATVFVFSTQKVHSNT